MDIGFRECELVVNVGVGEGYRIKVTSEHGGDDKLADERRRSTPFALKFDYTLSFIYCDSYAVDPFFDDEDSQLQWFEENRARERVFLRVPNSAWPNREIDFGGGTTGVQHFVLCLSDEWLHVLAKSVDIHGDSR
ncbi:MAG: hypothetical protein AAF608_08935 [Pseudomonadota bacterium]